MKKIIINLPDEAHNILKQYAARDYRSLSKYIQLWLTYLATEPYSSAPSPMYNDKMRDVYNKEEEKKRCQN